LDCSAIQIDSSGRWSGSAGNPLAGDLNELPSVVRPEAADVIKAARKKLVIEIEAATNHLVGQQHQFIVIDTSHLP
jgi:hypothetical protein